VGLELGLVLGFEGGEEFEVLGAARC